MSKALGSPLHALLRAIHDDRNDLVLSTFTDAQIRWAVASGLGPFLIRAVERDPAANASPHWPLLFGADRTARVLAAAQFDATVQLVDACRPHTTVTLLKGISLAERDYPSPHLRPMRDIDVLVSPDLVHTVQATLLGLGYREYVDPRFDGYGHHALPLVHPRTGIWIEVHHRLFAPGSELGGVDPFRPERVAANLRSSTFGGRAVNRLTDELEVAYIASHWALSGARVYDGGAVVPMLDLIHLIKGRALRWDDVIDPLSGSLASTHLHLLLGYLLRLGVAGVSRRAVERLARMKPSLDGVRQRVLHGILDRYVVEGRPYRGLARPATIAITWGTLLGPGSSIHNLARVPWRILRRTHGRLREDVANAARRTIRR